jgi:predicted RNA-binding Zn-ribbon protein involved in translation (DUF1610 family)
VVTRTVDARGSTLTLGRDFLPKEMIMTEINPCPKCGATVTVDQQYGDGMDVYCSNCGFVYFADPKIIHSIEEVIAAWNSQPVIERLREDNAALMEEIDCLNAFSFAVATWIDKGRNPKYYATMKERYDEWRSKYHPISLCSWRD